MQMTPEDPKKGLKYAAVEVPAGVRGRMALFGPMIDEAEAAIIINDADLSFGCMGCARTNELVKYLVRTRDDIPVLDLNYPSNEEEGIQFVADIKGFLDSLEVPGEKSAGKDNSGGEE
jgi:putative methanogenesis marker protein 5